MSVQITINGENASEAISEFAVLSAAFTGSAPAAPVVDKPKTRSKATQKQEEPEIKTADSEPEIKQEAANSEPETKQEDPDPLQEVTVEDIRAKAGEVGQMGKKAEVKALLDKFGAKTVSTVPAEKRAEFLAALKALVE
ncbi:hypothetical protein [Paenibacillus sp. URB8-2]|uniref:hypothetical protein n=1 Tax=Paenibacillus sp. URB8-2 TaxID=2741301 RepID=UPI0015C1953B|nr:hypothetical protein [Paenibacillus sp. URB8-2]BCG57460.1 hypothetical protein PUR_08850 [Paenibacillus sp. URB8-2]